MKRLCFILFLLFTTAAHAQQPGQNLRVYLVTYGPGDQVWEKFGHNALWIHDDMFGQDVAYNWGMFSFRQENFLKRFMQGRMLYWMQGFPLDLFDQTYIDTNRSIYVQELNLTPAERLQLARFVEWNEREENKYYRYDYYRDNCSTRVRDAIDRVTGGAVARALKPIRTDNTYRTHTQALSYTDPLLYTGLMYGLGPTVDEPISAWQEAFLPMELREWVRKVKVRAPDGTEQPLVVSERTLFEANRPPLAEKAPNMVLPFTAVGFVLAGLLLLLAVAGRVYRAVNILLALLVGIWELAAGLIGTLIGLAWAFTDHIVTRHNENLLQANTLSLVLMVFAVASVAGAAWARRWAVWLALFVSGCSVLGFLIQVFPQFNQANGEIIGLFMPVHGAIAYILWRRWRINPAAHP